MTATPIRTLIRVFTAALCLLLACSPVAAHPGIDKTVDHYSHLLLHNPGDVAARLARVSLFLARGKLAAAGADLDYLESHSPHINTGLLRGRIALKSGQSGEAAVQFSRCLDRFPGESRCYRLRSRARLALGDEQGALDDLFSAVEFRQPFDPGLIVETAELAGDMGYTAKALELIDNAQQAEGVIPALQLHTIQLLRNQGRPADALARLNGLLAATPANPAWLFLKAELFLELGQGTGSLEALAAARRALRHRKPTPWKQDQLDSIQRLETLIQTCVPAASCRLDTGWTAP